MLRLWGVWVGLGLLGCGDDSGPAMFADAGPLPDVGAVGCAGDEECDDGIFCNGPEQCLERTCQAGVPVDCDDADACTSDRCSEETRACVHLPPDADGDGHETLACGGDDCDDADPLRFPGNPETCDAHDEDCDATTLGARDADRDGAIDAACCNGGSCGDDCDDRSRRVHPLQIEVCDHADNDCDAMVDEAQTAAGFSDADRDFHGDPATGMRGCIGDAGFVLSADDCDDTSGARHPGQREVCDGIDNDCDTTIDEETGPATWYRDTDGDGFGAAASGTMLACAPPAGHVLLGTDCDDMRAGVNPAATEACNGVDDDCNGRADFAVGMANTEDDDADGVADMACPAGADCDDERPEVHAGATEICDMRDNDCDGTIDGPSAVPARFYPDVDGDGYGDASAAGEMTCMPAAGLVATGGDCDDSSAAIHPGATDACGDGDEDCDTRLDEDGTDPVTFYADADGDGFGVVGATTRVACSAPMGFGPPGDCNDADAGVSPAAVDRCNMRDDDCNGTIDDAAEASAACGLAGATATCTAGVCTVSACDTGRADCDAAAVNGCEVDTLTSAANCGGCRMPCVAGDSCVGGSCARSPIIALAGANLATYALRMSGGAAIWGSGPGADGSSSMRLRPVATELVDAIAISDSFDHGCAVRRGGGVLCWGEGFFGQLGDGTSTLGTRGPVAVRGIADATAVAVGRYHSCALRASREVWCWGGGAQGQLGNGSATGSLVPVRVTGIADAVGVMAFNQSSCAVHAGGTVSCWGAFAGLGDGSGSDRSTPGPVASITDAIAPAHGAGNRTHTCVRRMSGRVSCWGSGAQGRLGSGPSGCSDGAGATPVTMAGVTNAVEVALGVDHTCVRLASGEIWCAGGNRDLQLGRVAAFCDALPAAVPGIADATAIAGGLRHTCVLRSSGRVVCWGDNASGQLGTGSTMPASSMTPQMVVDLP